MAAQRTQSSLDFREFQSDDYPRLVDIYNSNYPETAFSISEYRRFEESIDQSKYLLWRIAATDSTSKVLGFGTIRHVLDNFHPRKFNINILVDPVEQGKGVGSAIFQKLDEELENRKALLAWTFTREDYQSQQDFYKRRGFRETLRQWDSQLDVKSVDTNQFQSYIQKAMDEGIVFSTLREEMRLGHSLKGLHELVQLIVADMPMDGAFTPISYEQWEKLNFNNPSLLPEGYIIAKHGSEFVGVSIVHRNEQEPCILRTDDTGVRREYRGKGIATALKLKVIQFAQTNGYERIDTRNDATNATMLAINVKLGFKRKIGWIQMKKELRREDP